jgi:nicotinamidase/pyrazinamidase
LIFIGISKNNITKERRMSKRVVLLIIDGQVDFCDPTGNLYVNGADKDMERLSKMILRCKGDIDDTIATLDSHHYVHIAHPVWWVDSNGNHPAPFTLIDESDVLGVNPKWKAFNPGYQKRSVEYVQALKTNGRYVLIIWPPHCLISGMGACLQPVLFDALLEWEKQFAAVNYVTKGSNIFTEHYSVCQADVFDPEDPKTGLNTDLIRLLQDPEVALIGLSGEASSHCLSSTVRDIANNFGEDNIKKLMLLEDTCSPVAGFEQQAADFINEMTARGMQISTSDKFLR